MRSPLHPARWRVLGYFPAAVAVARLRRKLGIPRPVSLAVVAVAPVAVAIGLPRSRSIFPSRHRRHAAARAVAVWLSHMWAYKVAFEIPYDRPAKLRTRLRIDEPIRADAVIGRGTPPGQRLQRRLRRPPRLTAVDWALTFVYLVWEIEPHAALFWILWRHPARFPGAALRLALTFDATVAGYFLVPTAPPWWASECEGRMDGEVHRVTVEVIRALRGEPRPAPSHNSGANPWASMPSDHFASTLSTAIALTEANPRVGTIGWVYALLLGSALVYTGEHYVIDLVAGAGLALAVHGAASAASSPLTRLWERLAAPAMGIPRRRRGPRGRGWARGRRGRLLGRP